MLNMILIIYYLKFYGKYDINHYIIWGFMANIILIIILSEVLFFFLFFCILHILSESIFLLFLYMFGFQISIMCSQLAHLAVSSALGMQLQDSWSVMLFNVTVAIHRILTHILVYVSKTNYKLYLKTLN